MVGNVLLCLAYRHNRRREFRTYYFLLTTYSLSPCFFSLPSRVGDGKHDGQRGEPPAQGRHRHEAIRQPAQGTPRRPQGRRRKAAARKHRAGPRERGRLENRWRGCHARIIANEAELETNGNLLLHLAPYFSPLAS